MNFRGARCRASVSRHRNPDIPWHSLRLICNATGRSFTPGSRKFLMTIVFAATTAASAATAAASSIRNKASSIEILPPLHLI